MNKTKFFSSLLVAALFASTSVFTSCKDYDDDIKNLQEQINARAMQTDLESLKSSLQAELTSVRQSLDTKTAALNQAIEKINSELATKANASDLNALATTVNSQAQSIQQLISSIDGLTAADAALQTQITAINQALDDYAKKKDLEDLAAKYVALKGDFEAAVAELNAKITAEAGARDAADVALQQKDVELKTAIDGVQANLDLQKQAFEAYKTEMAAKLATMEEQLKALHAVDITDLQGQITGINGKIGTIEGSIAAINGEIEGIKTTINTKVAELTQKINDVDAKFADYAKTADVNASLAALKQELKDDMTVLSTAINEVQNEVNIINAFIDKQLTSLVLMPDFYWEGLEAFEAPALIANVFKPIEAKNEKDYYEFSFTVSSESRPFFPYYPWNPGSSTLGDSEIKVKVPVTMGFLGDDGNTYGCEDENTWNEESRTKFLVTTVTPYTGQAEGENVWMSLNNADGKNLMPATVNPEPVAIQNGVLGVWHYNPATADLKGWKVNFFGNIAAHYTRGGLFNDYMSYNDLIGAEPFTSELGAENDANFYMNGILMVPFTVNYAYVLKKFAIWAGYNNTTVADGFGGTVVEPEWADRNLTGTKVDYAYGPYGFYPYLSEFDVTDNRDAYGTSIVDGVKREAYLPFVALQLEKEDTTVTSDYGVVVPAVLNIIALADNAPEAKIGGRNTQFSKSHAVDEKGYYGAVRANHLYESVGYKGCTDKDCYGAIPMPATHSVAYDGSIDLKPFIETHFDYTSYAKYGQSTKDQVMSEELMEDLGLKYQFSVVDYYLGNEKTSESAHIEEGEEGVFYPRSVNADGTTIKGETATREVIDREPLIRVDLVDKAGEIIRYGYIKLRITENAEVLNDVEVTITLDKDLYMNCGDNVRVTWSQMENLILRQLNLKKQEFEDNYYMENVGNHEYMPTVNPTTPNPWTNYYPGGLYDNADKYQWYAVRYAKAEEAAYAVDNDDDNLANVAKYTNTSNWFGRVWYTPHDNATTSQDWDSQTNVLVWNITDVEKEGNMTSAGFYKLRDVVGATYASKGISTEPLSTVVRFVNKTNGTSVWVTLVIPAGKIHFPYADIANKDLAHWYDFQTGYDREKNNDIEVYANVPTPAEVGLKSLDLSEGRKFEKNLSDFWLKNKGIFEIHEADKYGQLKNNVQPMFQFRLPKKGESAKDGVNSINENAASDGTWTVKGISGSTYTLKLDKGDDKTYNTQIVAVKRDGKDLNEIICTLDPESGKIHYMGRYEDNKAYNAATDILNYMGMYDQYGKLQRDGENGYLNGQDDKTFTAYVEIRLQSAKCIDPLIDNNYFNVRFLRPINAWGGEKKITDAPNKTQFINIWELLYIRDWRQYAVVKDGKKQTFGPKKDGTGMDGVEYEGKFIDGAKASVPYDFYKITNLYVDRKEIRSDHYLTESQRILQTDPAQIKKLYSVKDIPSLTSTDEVEIEYLKIINSNDAKDSYNVRTTTGQKTSQTTSDIIAYTNNGSVVQPFHIYVPISVEYSWGAVDKWTQTVWAVITVDPTVGQ